MVELHLVPPGGEPSGRLLIVDDEPLMRRVMARLATGAGFEAVQAASGEEALVALEEGAFDVVISDISMPGMGGMALLLAVAERDPELPVILVTGAPSIETAVEAVGYSAASYLIKPFERDQFLVQIRRAVGIRRLSMLRRQALELTAKAAGSGGDLDQLFRDFERVLGCFHMEYQPIIAAGRGSLYGHEALLRSSDAGLPDPESVLRAAERLGRVHELGRAVRSAVAQDILDHPGLGHVFVNLHPADLGDDQLLLPHAPLSQVADRVVLEITERASLDAVGDLRQRIGGLRRLGFRIAVDDLGAGYAGLTSFAILAPDLVKIDMSLIRGVDREVLRQKLVRALARTCLEMGIMVVAEGIETEQERDAVARLGCGLLQGFLLGRPRPLAEIPRL